MTVFIQKEKCDHVRIANNTGANLEQHEFTVVGPFAAVADNDILDGAVGSFHIEEGIQLHASDLLTGSDTFATVGQPVYWSPLDLKFSDVWADGYYLVGFLLAAKDSDGVIVFEKQRYAETEPSDVQAVLAALQTNEAKTVELAVEADASGGIEYTLAALGLAAGDKITDALVVATVTEASGTLKVGYVAGNDISDAIACATANALARAATLDQAEATIGAANLVVTAAGTTAANTRGIIYLTYIPA
jgi:hypothetical protein